MINYKLIDDSINYYDTKGFRRVESPWTVTEAVSNITKPPDKKQEFSLPYKNKVLVASGEQSFLYLYLKGFLPKGRFQTVTPCFRDDLFDFLHSKYFIKNELIDTGDTSDENLLNVVNTSLGFFRLYLPESKIVPTSDGFDIEWEGIELGSYGVRTCDFLKWVYGTGVAEPRLSSLIELRKNGGNK